MRASSTMCLPFWIEMRVNITLCCHFNLFVSVKKIFNCLKESVCWRCSMHITQSSILYTT